MTENEEKLKALAVASQAGNASSYTELLNLLMRFLQNYLRKRIFNYSEIEEVLQEILMAVHKSLHTYDSSKSFMGWFLAVSEYKIIDYIRAQKHKSNLIDIDELTHTLRYEIFNSDIKIDLERAFNKLDTREQAVLSLLKLEGHSVSDIALKLNLSEVNVKVIAHRAYQNLRLHLGGQS